LKEKNKILITHHSKAVQNAVSDAIRALGVNAVRFLHYPGVRHAGVKVRAKTEHRVEAKVRPAVLDEIIEAQVLREQYRRVIFQRSSSQRPHRTFSAPARSLFSPLLRLLVFILHFPRKVQKLSLAENLSQIFRLVREPKRHGDENEEGDENRVREQSSLSSLSSSSRRRRDEENHDDRLFVFLFVSHL
jgi:hypothetical protein